jgi:hypothetical protein
VQTKLKLGGGATADAGCPLDKDGCARRMKASRPPTTSRLGHCSLLLLHIKRLVSCTFSPPDPIFLRARIPYGIPRNSCSYSYRRRSHYEVPRAAQSKARPPWLRPLLLARQFPPTRALPTPTCQSCLRAGSPSGTTRTCPSKLSRNVAATRLLLALCVYLPRDVLLIQSQESQVLLRPDQHRRLAMGPADE